MSKEVLYVSEAHLRDVIRVIRAGLRTTKKLPEEVREHLAKWCDEEEEYLDRD